jgi:murein DD-endopeptidase MepM/ murein hydrolase activator NlpD
VGQKRTLSGWLTNRYLLIIRNEENFAEKKTLTFNYARIILILATGFIITLSLSIYLVTSVLEQWLDPRHAQMMTNRKIIELSMRIDSLEQSAQAKEVYIDNIKLILSGNDDVYEELNPAEAEEGQVYSGDQVFSTSIDPVDSQFRAEYENEDLGLINLVSNNQEEISDLYLFSPVSGIVSGAYEPSSNHYGIDVVAKENEPIKAVADGVVIFSSWTLDAGYVLGIQHRGNLMSVYKHNSELLKNVGSFVSGGDIIAIIGNTGELTTGPHLHLELWYKGNSVNPEDFFTF